MVADNVGVNVKRWGLGVVPWIEIRRVVEDRGLLDLPHNLFCHGHVQIVFEQPERVRQPAASMVATYIANAFHLLLHNWAIWVGTGLGTRFFLYSEFWDKSIDEISFVLERLHRMNGAQRE